ncbi:response regulator, partial [Pseudomonadota bacterium]
MVDCLLKYEISPQLDQVALIREQLDTLFLHHPHIDKRTVQNVLLAVSEILTNVIRHSEPKASRIDIEVNALTDCWQIVLSDDGGAFTDFQNIVRGLGDESSAMLSAMESGMGIGLVTTLFPKYEYRCEGDRNHFTLYLQGICSSPKPRVAIVDDEGVLRKLLSNYLSDDYQTVEYTDGMSALEGLSKTPADLVISDINMPNLNGLELRQALERSVGTQCMPFIFLTADDDLSTQDLAASLGIDDYLLKPVRKAQLLAVVTRVLTRAVHLKITMGNRLDSSITDALRPDLPAEMNGYRFAVRTRSTGSGGGDFIHYQDQGNKGLLLLGDIMGHGDVAKFFVHAHAAYLRGTMLALPASEGPAALLKNLAAVISDDSVLNSTLLTCQVLQFDESGISISSAGHPAPLIISEAATQEVDVGGALLALSDNTLYEESGLQLCGGQRLLLYTDGLLESSGELEQQAAFRITVLETLRASATLSIDEAADNVMQLFDRVCGDVPRDDA